MLICAAEGAEACGPVPYSDGIPCLLLTTTNGDAELWPPTVGQVSPQFAATSTDSRGILSESAAWIASQRASLAAICQQLAPAQASMGRRPDQHGEDACRQSTIFDLPGCSSRTAPASGHTGRLSGEPCEIEDTIPEMERLAPTPSALRMSACVGSCSQLGPTLTKANANGNAQPRQPGTKRGETLPHLFRRLLPNLCATDYKSPYSRQGYLKQRQKRSKPLRDTAAHTIGIRLTPDFCEWWMGWPIGASASRHLEMHGCHCKRPSPGDC